MMFPSPCGVKVVANKGMSADMPSPNYASFRPLAG